MSELQDNNEQLRKIHIIACAALGLDDEDHEDDELAETLENVLLAFIKQHDKQLIQDIRDELLSFINQHNDLPRKKALIQFDIALRSKKEQL